MGIATRNSDWAPAAAVLRRYAGHQHEIPIADLAWFCHCSDDSIGHYARAETVPDAEFLRLLARHFGKTHPQFVLDLFNELLAGSGFRVVDERTPDAEDLDVNGDGRIDGRDSAKLGVGTLEKVQKCIDRLVDALGDGRLSREEAGEACRLAEQISRGASLLVQSLVVQSRK